MTSYQDLITIEPRKEGGRPCVRGLPVTVADVLGWLAAGLSQAEILADYPELAADDIVPVWLTRPIVNDDRRRLPTMKLDT